MFLRSTRYLVRAFTTADTPKQLALGFALGMIIGLVPKGNLTAVALSVLLLATRVNLGAGMVAALGFSTIGPWLDPLTHRIGLAALTEPRLLGFWTWLFEMPVMPWTALNNTVVLGALLLGAWLFYPVYRLGGWGFERLRPAIAERCKRLKIARVLLGLDLATAGRLR